MRKTMLGGLGICALALWGCTTPKPDYTPPETAGLVGLLAYPGPGDICQIIGENDVTQDYLDDSTTLVGCPFFETDEIADLQDNGATTIREIGDWVLFSVPNPDLSALDI